MEPPGVFVCIRDHDDDVLKHFSSFFFPLLVLFFLFAPFFSRTKCLRIIFLGHSSTKGYVLTEFHSKVNYLKFHEIKITLAHIIGIPFQCLCSLNPRIEVKYSSLIKTSWSSYVAITFYSKMM